MFPFVSRLIRRCYSTKDTIFGLSSGSGKCGVAVIRVSGEAASELVRRKTCNPKLPVPRKAVLRKIFHCNSRELIDRGLILWFPGPNSFTGEDSAEFHVHGGLAVINAMYESLGSFEGVRLAEAGEFTKRAFYAGKMDLTEVEGLADLIEAETEAQRKQALLQANGELSRLYNEMRERLLKCIAHVEAYIDFAEDQDVDDGVLDSVKREVETLTVDIQAHLNDHRRGERLRAGVRTAIIGAPNVGKSSFVNLISNRKVSIVTNIAGTTRDIIETHHDIGGYPVILADTAGLRAKTTDIVEHEGIERAKDYLSSADFLILIIDSENLNNLLKANSNNFETCLDSYLSSFGIGKKQFSSVRSLVIVNKSDLLDKEDLIRLETIPNIRLLSCYSKQGIEGVLNEMNQHLKQLCGNPTKESPNLSQQRHRYHLKRCVEYLDKYRRYLEQENYPDLAIATQHLRNATRCIGRITGTIDTEEILDVIFSSFCIGK
ncbi:tRNA modification GTPase GTPBP3, mitochondrial [Uranotaenia lowii]|uniref:tRNA modification GTPase GTPBP3, mitochondrial n=1 Tax=Uranotaenia lowii TaxID=190385 RepID=UPI002479769B|nr:tRNA modification GTPase GTPBP3, mitochondrial [Uranotaenia lowii]